jgi:hypothetical protein
MESVALQRLRTMATAWDARNDRRAIFADAYGRMTAAMLDAIDGDEFADGGWVARLLDRFADYYFLAADAWEAGEGCPDVWCDVFETTSKDELNALQALFLGINAHINHDLVYALADVLDDWESLDQSRRLLRRRDHAGVNLVIARTVDVVQEEVVESRSPIFGLLDTAFGQIDEWVFSRLIAEWRSHVWDDAQRLLASPRSERPSIDADVCTRTRRIARMVVAL